jgi:hypothetical protein
MVKRKVTTYVDEKLWQEFVKVSVSRTMEKAGSAYGAISKAMEEALRMWIDKQEK